MTQVRTVMVMGALVLLLIVASSAAIMPTMAGGCIASYRTVVGQAYPKGPNILSHPRNSSATDCCSLCKPRQGVLAGLSWQVRIVSATLPTLQQSSLLIRRRALFLVLAIHQYVWALTIYYRLLSCMLYVCMLTC